MDLTLEDLALDGGWNYTHEAAGAAYQSNAKGKQPAAHEPPAPARARTRPAPAASGAGAGAGADSGAGAGQDADADAGEDEDEDEDEDDIWDALESKRAAAWEAFMMEEKGLSREEVEVVKQRKQWKEDMVLYKLMEKNGDHLCDREAIEVGVGLATAYDGLGRRDLAVRARVRGTRRAELS